MPMGISLYMHLKRLTKLERHDTVPTQHVVDAPHVMVAHQITKRATTASAWFVNVNGAIDNCFGRSMNSQLHEYDIHSGHERRDVSKSTPGCLALSEDPLFALLLDSNALGRNPPHSLQATQRLDRET